MNRFLISVLIAILLMVSLPACYTMPKNHVKLVGEGKQPRIALIPFFKNNIFFAYIDTVAFGSRLYSYDTTIDFEPIVIQKAVDVVRDDSVIDLYLPKKQETLELLNNLEHEKRYYWRNIFSEQDRAMISKWGRARSLDYIAFVNPGTIIVRPGRDPVAAMEKGIIADTVGTQSWVCKYAIVLFDVKTGKNDDSVAETTYVQKPTPLRKKLSKEQIDRITADWEYEKSRDENHGLTSSSLEWELKAASFYRGRDFGILTKEQLHNLDIGFIPVVEENIHNLLIKIGFARED